MTYTHFARQRSKTVRNWMVPTLGTLAITLAAEVTRADGETPNMDSLDAGVSPAPAAPSEPVTPSSTAPVLTDAAAPSAPSPSEPTTPPPPATTPEPTKPAEPGTQAQSESPAPSASSSTPPEPAKPSEPGRAFAPTPSALLAPPALRPTHPDVLPWVPSPRPRFFGVAMDIGVPDGASFGLSLRPVQWLRLGAAATYNGMAPGVRGGVTLDPIPGPFGLTLTAEGGRSFDGGVHDLPSIRSVSYSYANLHAGIEVGARSSFRVFLRGGVSYLDGNLVASNLGFGSSLGNVLAVSYTGWVTPTAKFGFVQYF